MGRVGRKGDEVEEVMTMILKYFLMCPRIHHQNNYTFILVYLRFYYELRYYSYYIYTTDTHTDDNAIHSLSSDKELAEEEEKHRIMISKDETNKIV